MTFLIVKELEKKKDRPLRALVKKLAKNADHSESHQNSKSEESECQRGSEIIS